MGTETLEKPKEVGKRAWIPVADILPNPANRKLGNDEDIGPFAKTVKEVGLLYPVIVRHHPDEPGKYRIIAGERRWRALKRLGIEMAPCLLVSGSEEELLAAEIIRVVENHQRKAPTAFEEAEAVRTLLELGLETPAIARSLGRSRSWVARRSSLTELSQAWLDELMRFDSKIALWPASHLEMVSRFPAEVQDQILGQWINEWRWRIPDLSELTDVTGSYLHLIASAPWKPDDDTLCPLTGACTSCPKRSSHHPDLFGDELPGGAKGEKNDRCLDPACWLEKGKAFLKRRVEEVKTEHEHFALLVNDEAEEEVDIEPQDRPVVYSPQVTLCKKSDKRAFPALVVAGPGLGRIKWIQLPKEPKAQPSGAHSAEENGATETPGEKTLEQRRESYDRRRRQIVIEAVEGKLDVLALTDEADAPSIEGGKALTERGMVVKTLHLLYMLLREGGWCDSTFDPRQEIPETISWENLSSLRKDGLGSPEVHEAVISVCWNLQRLCLHALSGRLSVPSHERNNHRQYLEAEFICELLGFDLETLRAQAAEAIPYAKAWKDEVQDEWNTSSSGNGTQSG